MPVTSWETRTVVPTYEYECKGCGRAFETVQGFTDLPLTVCDVCGGSLKKVYGAVGIVFKGSGFYKTDSRPADSSSSRSESAAASSNGHDAHAKSDGEQKSTTDSSSKPESTPSEKKKDTATAPK